MVPNWLTRLLNKLRIPGFYVAGNKKRRVIYLTLDDGPNPKTQDLFLWMETQNIQATHFWVGERIKNTDLDLQKLHGQHFAVHGFSHKRYSRFSSTEIQFELNQINKLDLNSSMGFQPWFRTPYGSWKPGLTSKLKQEGFRIIFWSFLFKDWLESFNPDEINKRKNEWLYPGSILVFHDKPQFHDRVKKSIEIVKEICNQNEFELSCLPSPN